MGPRSLAATGSSRRAHASNSSPAMKRSDVPNLRRGSSRAYGGRDDRKEAHLVYRNSGERDACCQATPLSFGPKQPGKGQGGHEGACVAQRMCEETDLRCRRT